MSSEYVYNSQSKRLIPLYGRDTDNSVAWAWADTLLKQCLRPELNSYFLTFKFKPMTRNSPSLNDKRSLTWASTEAIQKLMVDDITTFHSRLVTRAVHDPRKRKYWHLVPHLVTVPDYPVAHNARTRGQSKTEWPINDGLHYHGIAYFNNNYRFRGDFYAHFESNWHQYLDELNYLRQIDVRPITHDPQRASLYLFKMLFHHTITDSDIVILGNIHK